MDRQANWSLHEAIFLSWKPEDDAGKQGRKVIFIFSSFFYLHNKRYMENSKDGKPRLNIDFGDYGMPGWTDSEGRTHKPTYDVPLPYNAPAPGSEIKYS